MDPGSSLAVPCEAGAQARRSGYRPDGDGYRAGPTARHPGHRTARYSSWSRAFPCPASDRTGLRTAAVDGIGIAVRTVLSA